MLNQVFFFAAALFVFFWGAAHLFATRSVVRGFGEISADNQKIITMEWIVEGTALMFIGLVVAVVTVIDSSQPVAKAVYWLSFATLNILSIISLFTGFKVRLLPFKLCPAIFTAAAILLLLGILL